MITIQIAYSQNKLSTQPMEVKIFISISLLLMKDEKERYG